MRDWHDQPQPGRDDDGEPLVNWAQILLILLGAFAFTGAILLLATCVGAQ